jgi:hypothetical protein
MYNLDMAFSNYCTHKNAVVINKTKHLIHCMNCNTKFICNHTYGTYTLQGIFNGEPPKMCNICHTTLTDFLGRKI